MRKIVRKLKEIYQVRIRPLMCFCEDHEDEEIGTYNFQQSSKHPGMSFTRFRCVHCHKERWVNNNSGQNATCPLDDYEAQLAAF